jgi:hypothetical protein
MRYKAPRLSLGVFLPKAYHSCKRVDSIIRWRRLKGFYVGVKKELGLLCRNIVCE